MSKSSGAFVFSQSSSGVARTAIILGLGVFLLMFLLMGCWGNPDYVPPKAQISNAKANEQYAHNDAVRAKGDAKATEELAKAEADALVVAAEAEAERILKEARTEAFLQEEPLRQQRLVIDQWIMERTTAQEQFEANSAQQRAMIEQNAHQQRIMANFILVAMVTVPVIAIALIVGGVLMLYQIRKSEELSKVMKQESDKQFWSVVVALTRGKFPSSRMQSVGEELEDVR